MTSAAGTMPAEAARLASAAWPLIPLRN